MTCSNERRKGAALQNILPDGNTDHGKGISIKHRVSFHSFLLHHIPWPSPSTCGLTSQFPVPIHSFFSLLCFNSLMYSFYHLFINFLITHVANIYWASNCRLDLLGSFYMVDFLISMTKLTTIATSIY